MNEYTVYTVSTLESEEKNDYSNVSIDVPKTNAYDDRARLKALADDFLFTMDVPAKRLSVQVGDELLGSLDDLLNELDELDDKHTDSE